MEKVVVTALGVTKKEKSLGFCSQEVNGDALDQNWDANFLNTLQGKVYQKIVSRATLDAYAGQYRSISNKMVGGKPLIHIYSDTDPKNDFEEVKPNLEDVFFSKIISCVG